MTHPRRGKGRPARTASSGAGPAVSLAQAHAFVLAKHGLAGAGLRNVYTATLATAGVYSTAPTCYLSYATRIEGFRLAHLDRELYQKRRLVRLRCMRQSAYIEPLEWLPVVHAATSAGGEKAFLRIVRLSGLTEREFAALADRIERVLAGHDPVTVPELRKLLGPHAPPGQALQYAVALLSRQARLVRAEVRGSWTSNTYTYARWVDWVGRPLEKIAPEAARAALARYYLRAFGPATAADLRWWAGWTARETMAALAALGDAVTAVSLTASEPSAVEALVLADEAPALSSARAGDAAGVRLLPVWDAYTMGYIDRRRFVSAADYPRIYDFGGNGTSVLLVDGVAAGVWEFDPPTDLPGGSLNVRIAPFSAPVSRRWPEVEDAAARVADAIGAKTLRVQRAPRPGLLAKGARNAFLSPIRLGRSS